MINCIIIDDELHSIETLKWKISNCSTDVAVLKCFTKPHEALHYLKIHKIDLVFLDIEMPKMNGFELLEYLDRVDFSIIFTTAYNEYALRAIKLSALDYLLKPIDINELKKAIDKQRKAYHKLEFQTNYNNFLDNKKRDFLSQKISVCSKEKIEFLIVGDIIYCKSDGNYTILHLMDGTKRTVTKTLKDFDLMLLNRGFFRLHNSYLVNTHHIKEIRKSEGGSVVMINGDTLPISRTRKQELMKILT